MNSENTARVVFLDGAQMTDKDRAHAHIACAFGFPEWYGNNLDALWDMLTTWPETDISFGNAHHVPVLLGEYGDALIDTFREAADENPRLQLHFEEC